MYAPKVARPDSKDSLGRSAQRGPRLAWHAWQSDDPERVRPLSAASAASSLGHDFSRIPVHSAQDAVRSITVPFRAVIPAARPNAGAASKTVHDATAAGASAGPVRQPAGAETETASPAVEDENGVLYIAQMAGAPGTKTTTADSVGATLAYTVTTTRDAAALSATDFGDTTGSLKRFSNVSIPPSAAGKFTVTADLKQTVKWDTQATTGPNAQVNITSAADAALTNANYAQVVTDLTPDVADLKGRPPRTKFWSKDFTEKHEKYHVKDFEDKAKSGAADAETWLATKTAATKAEVQTLLDTAWTDKIFTPWDTFTNPPAVEERAYSDGAASYTARANAIKARGDKGAAGGGYP